MAGAKAFTELLIWQRARGWSKEIFIQTGHSPFCNDKRLVVQINDSSASVMANIAEGFGRGTQGEFVQFLGYALGSLDETRSHLVVAYDRQYLEAATYEHLFRDGVAIRKMAVAFISSMVMSGSGVKNIRRVADWSDQAWEIYERVTGKPRPEMFQKEAERKKEIAESI